MADKRFAMNLRSQSRARSGVHSVRADLTRFTWVSRPTLAHLCGWTATCVTTILIEWA
ncbi:hypothetical protein ACFL5A_00350 [Gemmatimonadota bacterium]